jgi:hypothetical protein
MSNRAIHEIQVEAMRLLQVNAPDAVDGRNWASLHRLCERLAELAQRGFHHEAMLRQSEITRFAMNGYSEPEPR